MKQSASGFALRAFIAVALVLVLGTWTRVAQAQQLAAFSDSAGETVFYIGVKGDIHQLYCDRGSMCWLQSKWLDNDLTPQITTNRAGLWSLTGLSDASGQHLFYADYLHNINRFDCSAICSYGSNWVRGNLGVNSSSGALSSSFDAPDRWFPFNVFEYAYSETDDQHVWAIAPFITDLTALPGGKPGGALTSFSDASGEHVYYVSTDSHIYEAFGQWSVDENGGWTLTWVNKGDLTFQAGGAPVAVNKDVFQATLSVPNLTSLNDAQGAQIYYAATGGHVHRLYFGSAPVDQDITGSASLVDAASPMSSVSDAFGEHVYYVGNGHVRELYCGASCNLSSNWGGRDLTQLAGGAQVGACGDMPLTSLSDAYGEKVFYVAWDHSTPNNPITLHAISKVGLGWVDQVLAGSGKNQPINPCNMTP